MIRIGFLGFGEAASKLALGLGDCGQTGLVAYDIAWQSSELVQQRSERTGVELVATPHELTRKAELIFSAVVCTEAERAAATIADGLDERHWVLDINSVAPGVKAGIGAVVEARGASYLDVAVMGNATSDLARLPLLVAGPRAHDLVGLLPQVPLQVTPLSAVPGDAARLKMFRSLFGKGLEALSLEVMAAAYPNGVHEDVLRSFEESFGHLSFGDLVKHLIERHAVHGVRRANELHEVAATVAEAGVEPIMARAGFERASWDVRRGLQDAFQAEEDPHWIEVLAALDALRVAEEVNR